MKITQVAKQAVKGVAGSREALPKQLLTAFGIAVLLTLLSGCATHYQASSPWQYNPATGYPAVGAPLGWMSS